MKIAIACDKKMIVEPLVKALRSGNHTVLWIARNSQELIDKKQYQPIDLLIVVVSFPSLDSLSIIREAMKDGAMPVLLASTNVTEDASLVFEAMGQGALDVFAMKATNFEMSKEDTEALLAKVSIISKLFGVRDKDTRITKNKTFYVEKSLLPPLVVMGASTGGPAALAKILKCFAKEVPFAVLIVQHIDQQFSEGLANWLAKQIELPVSLARSGTLPTAGQVFIAAQNQHIVITKSGDISYIEIPDARVYCPSIDVFFQSVAENWPTHSVAVLLTGMGQDGAEGLKMLRSIGWTTIVEDQSTCVVYGMPKAALEKGAAVNVLPIDQIGTAILKYFRSGGLHD